MKLLSNIHSSHVGASLTYIFMTMAFVAIVRAQENIEPPKITPDKGALERTTTIRVTFGSPMIDLDTLKINKMHRRTQASPIVFEPAVDFEWTWVSQTEGRINISYLPYARDEITYRLKLTLGIKDLEGNTVGDERWHVEYTRPTFDLRLMEVGENVIYEGDEPSGSYKESQIPARPRVRLEFTKDVFAADLSKAAHFQDCESGEKFEAEVNIEATQNPKAQGWLFLEPAADLPPERSYYVVIEGLKDGERNKMGQNVLAVPIGTTYRPNMYAARGHNQPGKGAFIRIFCDQRFQQTPENIQSIQIIPAVGNISFLSCRNYIEVYGAFRAEQTYDLRVKGAMKSVLGLSVGQDFISAVDIPFKRPAIVLPRERVYQKASTGVVKIDFIQVNTKPLDWRIARIPPNRCREVLERLREFGEIRTVSEEERATIDEKEFRIGKSGRLYDRSSGEALYEGTTILIDDLELPVLDHGRFDESGADKETTRSVEWRAPDNEPDLLLYEVTGTDSAGRSIGNRMIVSRTKWMINAVESPEGTGLRLFGIDDCKPVPRMKLRLMGGEGSGDSIVQTDGSGKVMVGDQPDYVQVESAGRSCLLSVNPSSFVSGYPFGRADDEDEIRGTIVTDRNVYSPEETVNMQVYLRQILNGNLSADFSESATLVVKEADSERVIEELELHGRNGAFPAQWRIPSDAYGDYVIAIKGEGVHVTVKVSEFRPPPFTCSVSTTANVGQRANATVFSQHFYGAPNAGAKVHWKAEWVVDNWGDSSSDKGEKPHEDDDESTDNPPVYRKNDLYSPDSPERRLPGEVLDGLMKSGWYSDNQEAATQAAGFTQGEATLDESGEITIESSCPHHLSRHPRFKVYWIVDVTSNVTKQTVRGGSVGYIQAAPEILEVSLRSVDEKTVALNVNALDILDKIRRGVMVKAEVFALHIDTVKEQVSPGFHKYVNTPTFTKVYEKNLTTPCAVEVGTLSPGDYVARVSSLGNKNIAQVSDSICTAISGDDFDVAVATDTSLDVTLDKMRYKAGENMIVTVRSPNPGPAVLSVEAGDIIHTQVIEVKGNISSFSISVRETYAPNVWITVHQLIPLEGGEVPRERFGYCAAEVDLPRQQLEVEVKLQGLAVQPGDSATGSVLITQHATPVADADVLIFAVNEAVLEIGRWSLPDFRHSFFPLREWKVRTKAALNGDWSPRSKDELTHSQKGYILGDYGFGGGPLDYRRDFKALAYWKTDHKTDKNGIVRFSFKVPDSLTKYRVVAVAQKDADKFGEGNALLRVSKALRIESLLPTFLRQGDVLTLRASISQEYSAQDSVLVEVDVNDDLHVEGEKRKVLRVEKGRPVVAEFPATVKAGGGRAIINFSASSSRQFKVKDAESRSFTIHPSTSARSRVLSGRFEANERLPSVPLLAESARSSEGTCDLILSGSAYLPKIAGIFGLIDAQGSSEKLATRLLALSLIAQAGDYLPMEPVRQDTMKQRAEEALKRLLRAQVHEGGLGRWPRERGAMLARDEFATIQGAWAIRRASNAFPDLVGESALYEADNWLKSIILREEGYEDMSPSARCFALMAFGHSLSPRDNAELPALEESIKDLYKMRETYKLATQDISWLLLSMHYMRVLSDEAQSLLEEVKEVSKIQNPRLLQSEVRDETLSLLAQSELQAFVSGGPVRAGIAKKFEAIAASSMDLTTQENLWLFLLFNSLVESDVPDIIMDKVSPSPPYRSRNGISVGWLRTPLKSIWDNLEGGVYSQVPGSYLIRAEMRGAESGEVKAPTLSVQRSVRNLTARSRDGGAASPWHIGDHVLISYSVDTKTEHSHLEFDDDLPACLEIVNPDLPVVAQNFQPGIEAGVNQLRLAHKELRFAHTMLYFDKAPAGLSRYSVLARVTVPGGFHWPGTRIQAMYDARFYAKSKDTVVHAK